MFIEIQTLTMCRDSTFTLSISSHMRPNGFDAAAFNIFSCNKVYITRFKVGIYGKDRWENDCRIDYTAFVVGNHGDA